MPPIFPEKGPRAGEQKRFVRTLEHDTEALKSGAVPDFIEVDEGLPQGPSVDLPPTILPKAPEILEPPPLGPSPLDRLIENTPLPPPPATPPLPPLPPQAAPPIQSPDEATLRTYTSDFSEEIKKTNASTASIIAAEEDAKRAVTRKPNRALSYLQIGGGVLLISLGAFGAYFAYRFTNQPAPIIDSTLSTTPIFVNEHETITGKAAGLASAISISASKPLQGNGVRALSLDSGDIFHALTLPAPDVLLRNVNASGSMAGVVQVNGNESPFFILSVSSYADTFAGMLAWEPKMPSDLATLFPSTGGSSSTATLSTGVSSPIPSQFQDATIQNHDVRLLKDVSGNAIITYGYWNPATLIIAKNEAAFSEIVSRLGSSRTQK